MKKLASKKNHMSPLLTFFIILVTSTGPSVLIDLINLLNPSGSGFLFLLAIK